MELNLFVNFFLNLELSNVDGYDRRFVQCDDSYRAVIITHVMSEECLRWTEENSQMSGCPV